MDAERPSKTQAVDNGIECNTNDSATCTASGENDTVGQATSAKEVLRGSYSDRLEGLLALWKYFIVKACDIP